jgi:glycosyltransferase involved in cell wall biosynthesis
MRVLHVHSGNLYGGIETLLVTLARHRELSPQMEPHFALCFAGRLSDELQAAGARVHFLGEARVRSWTSVRRARRALGELLRAESFDVALCHSSWSQALFGRVVREAGLPLVFWLHGEAYGRRWLELWARATPPDLALCNSRFTASTLPRLYPRARTETIYCPVPCNGKVHTNDRAAMRATFGTPEDAVVIVQASRMEPWKGHRLHLKSLALLRDMPNWMCWQVGGGQRAREEKYLEGLKVQAARSGIAERVRFLGERCDIPDLLSAADVHCQPNTGPEPFGITFVEALSAKLPVVTTAIGGACEIVDETCGVLVPPGDTRALAAALRKLIEDDGLRRRLGAAGPARAARLCDTGTQMRKLSAALASVC